MDEISFLPFICQLLHFSLLFKSSLLTVWRLLIGNFSCSFILSVLCCSMQTSLCSSSPSSTSHLIINTRCFSATITILKHCMYPINVSNHKIVESKRLQLTWCFLIFESSFLHTKIFLTKAPLCYQFEGRTLNENIPPFRFFSYSYTSRRS